MADEMDMLIATVTCPKCGTEFQLSDTPWFEPGKQPRKYPDPEPIKFPCCGEPQTVQAESVKYRPKR
jgi:endogenous inhibitor of DNA gyrase (YacG/DUF329 family)